MQWKWFVNFWNWWERQINEGHTPGHLLHRIRYVWSERWLAEPDHKRAVPDLAKEVQLQREFLAWFESEFAPQRLGSVQAGQVLLAQLASLWPFVFWETLEQYRNLQILPGANAILLHKETEGNVKDVVRLAVILVPGQSQAGLFHFCNLGIDAEKVEEEPLKAGAKQAIEQNVRDATLALLQGKAFWKLAWRWLFISPAGHSTRTRKLLRSGWCLSVAFTLAALSGVIVGPLVLAESYAPLLLSVVALLPSLYLSVTKLRLIWNARKHGKKWGALLAKGKLYLFINDETLDEIHGSSFGLALHLALLLALDEAAPVVRSESQLWTEFVRWLRQAMPDFVSTGSVLHTGEIGAMKDLDVLAAKLRAAKQWAELRADGTDHRSFLFMPRQPEAPDGNHWLEVIPCSRVEEALLVTGGLPCVPTPIARKRSFFRYARAVANGLVFLAPVILTVIAAYQLAFPPAPPQFVFLECYKLDNKTTRDVKIIHLTFETHQEHCFRARLMSINCLREQPLNKCPGYEYKAETRFDDLDVDNCLVPKSVGLAESEIQVVSPQQFLWLRLPDAIVVRWSLSDILRKANEESLENSKKHN